MIHNQILVRRLSVRPPLFLAPMAGLTHSALRTLLLSFGGVGLLSTEMLSARRLPAESAHSSPYLVRTAGKGLFPTSFWSPPLRRWRRPWRSCIDWARTPSISISAVLRRRSGWQGAAAP